MSKKVSLIMIICLSILFLIIIIIKGNYHRYNSYVLKSNIRKFISDKTYDDSIKLESLKFNNIPLLIDNSKNIVFYSLTPSESSLNPFVDYEANQKNIKIAFSSPIEIKKIDTVIYGKVIVYNKDRYNDYVFCLTKYPLLDIVFDENASSLKDITTKVFYYDNNVKSSFNFLETDGLLHILSGHKEYDLSLYFSSPSNNKRERNFIINNNSYSDIHLSSESESDDIVQLFINGENIGLFYISEKRE